MCNSNSLVASTGYGFSMRTALLEQVSMASTSKSTWSPISMTGFAKSVVLRLDYTSCHSWRIEVIRNLKLCAQHWSWQWYRWWTWGSDVRGVYSTSWDVNSCAEQLEFSSNYRGGCGCAKPVSAGHGKMGAGSRSPSNSYVTMELQWLMLLLLLVIDYWFPDRQGSLTRRIE